MKKIKITYWVSTGLLSAMIVMAVGMYFFNNEEVSKTFEAFGYPAYLVYPLAIAKLLGLVAIWTNKGKSLKEWAYAGFFFDFVLAAFAHISVGDDEFGGPILAMVLLLTSYFSWKKISN